MQRSWALRLGTAIDAVCARDFAVLRAAVERGLFPASLFRRNRLLIAALREPRPPQRFLDDFRVRWAARRDIGALAQVRERSEQFEAFFGAGHLCVIGELAGLPVTFSWLELDCEHVSRFNGYRFSSGPGSAWAFGCALRPGLEGEGLLHQHWYRKMQLLARGGVDETVLAIQDDCPAERLEYGRIGFRPTHSLRVLRVLGATFHRARALEGTRPRTRRGVGAWRGSALLSGDPGGGGSSRALSTG